MGTISRSPANSLENVCAERPRKPDYRETLSWRNSPFIKHTGYRQQSRSPKCTKASCFRSFRSWQPIACDKEYYRHVHQQLAQLSHKTSIGRGERYSGLWMKTARGKQLAGILRVIREMCSLSIETITRD